MRRKPWRRIAVHKKPDDYIRKICCCILFLELAFFVRESGSSLFAISRQQEEHVAEADADAVEGQEKIYGLRIRIKDGVVEFYQKEIYKQKEDLLLE